MEKDPVEHEDAAALLHDYHYGRLDEGVRTPLREHISGCDECGALSETYRLVHAALHDEAAAESTGHATSEEIVAYAIDRSSLDPAASLRVAEHVGSCAACADDVRSTVKLHEHVKADSRGSRMSARRIRGQRSIWQVAVVFGMLLVAALLLADLIVRLGRPGADVAAWGGAVPLTVLSSSLRDGSAVPSVPVSVGQSHVLLAVELDLSVDPIEGETVHVEVRRDAGAAVWSVELASSRVRDDLLAQGVATFLIPAEVLDAGRYEVRITDRREAVPLLQAWFEVDRREER